MSPTVVGGIRGRLIMESFRRMLTDALDQRGWFDAGRRHRPITITPRQYKIDEEIPLNTMAVCESGVDDEQAELGSLLTEDRWIVYVDFYAESDSLGREVIHDVRDILRGKMQSTGRTGPILEVFDWREDSPNFLFFCELENIVVDKAENFPHPWQQHWYSIRCDLIDTYGSEEDGGP